MANKGWKALRERAERGPSANFMRLKDGEKTKVRFLVQDEDDVVYYREHYVDNKYRICQDDTEDETGDCVWCDEGDRPGEKYAFNVIDRKDGKVKVLQLAIGHATQILEFFDEYGTISDRDYKVSRHGNKAQTRYTFVPLKESKMDAADKKLIKEKYSLEELYAPREIEKPDKKKKKRLTDETENKKKKKNKKAAKEEEPDDDEDEEEEDEASPKELKKKSPPPEDDDEDDEELDEDDDGDDDLEEEEEEDDEDDEDDEEDDEDEDEDDDEEDDEEDEEEDDDEDDDDDLDLEDDD